MDKYKNKENIKIEINIDSRKKLILMILFFLTLAIGMILIFSLAIGTYYYEKSMFVLIFSSIVGFMQGLFMIYLMRITNQSEDLRTKK